MKQLLEQLHDIDGLDPISMWPLAIGWWVLLVLGLLLLIGVVVFASKKIAYRYSWRYDTIQKLSDLEKNLTDKTAKETVLVLSEYLRRIAIKRYPRNQCAGLVGNTWLKWLSQHDPKKFDWENQGTLLIKAPYAPQEHSLPTGEVKLLLQAAKNWVH